jgi:hypothetical protein
MAVDRRSGNGFQLARLVGIAIEQTEDQEDDGKDAAASELGPLGRLRGQGASPQIVSAKRKAIARKAARARLSREPPDLLNRLLVVGFFFAFGKSWHIVSNQVFRNQDPAQIMNVVIFDDK